ncbi:MFS transporter [Microbacterium sp. LWS13-1.2]|uniref:Putative proline/betaine transporter n=1 Tax=Microbacterium sp. LWS13-1.2 TaxID=3135264 RepID=A0AAU6SE56_9MICO
MEQNLTATPEPRVGAVNPPHHTDIRTARRVIVAAALGNFVEWFDYGVYGFLAATIAKVFFPGTDPTTQIIAAIGVFGVGFLIRPIGAIIFGSHADKHGRKPVMLFTVVLMSGATFLIGVLPTYQAIGLWAPALLIVIRLLQGIGAGGEVGSVTVVLSEAAPPRRRGFAGSMSPVSSFMAFLTASTLVLLLNVSLTPDQLEAWGWRIPFLLSLPLGFVGLLLRWRLEETVPFKQLVDENRVSPAPVREVFRKSPGAMLVMGGITATTAVGLWMLVTYMTSFLSNTVGLTGTQSILTTVLGVAAALLFTLLGGVLSDRFGRRRMLIITTSLLVVFVYPCFLLATTGNLPSAIAGLILFGALLGLFDGGFTAAAAELFPTRYRTAGVALPFNVGAAIFGGGVPYASAWLVQATGNQQAGAWLVILAAAISLLAAIAIPAATHGRFLAGRPLDAND